MPESESRMSSLRAPRSSRLSTDGCPSVGGLRVMMRRASAALERAAGIPAVVAQLLIGRGISCPTTPATVSRRQAQRAARSGSAARRGRRRPRFCIRRFATGGGSSSMATTTPTA